MRMMWGNNNIHSYSYAYKTTRPLQCRTTAAVQHDAWIRTHRERQREQGWTERKRKRQRAKEAHHSNTYSHDIILRCSLHTTTAVNVLVYTRYLYSSKQQQQLFVTNDRIIMTVEAHTHCCQMAKTITHYVRTTTRFVLVAVVSHNIPLAAPRNLSGGNKCKVMCVMTVWTEWWWLEPYHQHSLLLSLPFWTVCSMRELQRWPLISKHSERKKTLKHEEPSRKVHSLTPTTSSLIYIVILLWYTACHIIQLIRRYRQEQKSCFCGCFRIDILLLLLL